MNRNKAIATIKKHAKKIQSDFKVESIYLFGSVARNEASRKSDVDILVSFSSNDVGYFEFLRLKDYLESILKTKVDLVVRDSLKDWMLAAIEKDAIRAA